MHLPHSTHRFLCLSATLILLILAATGGAAAYLLDYALKPGDRSRQTDRAWHEMDSIYPGLRHWRDSLSARKAWRDTTIKAPDGTALHAYYSARMPHTRRTALLIHGYTDCAIRMMHLGRMYERDLNANLLVPDLRNAGASGGDHFQMGWNDRLDMKLWLTLVPQLFGDSAQVIVHGVSMGAATAMMLSGDADVPPIVAGYIEDCGYTTVDDQFSRELKTQFGLPRQPLIPIASALCRLRYGWSFGEASALRQVAHCGRPMLFIHGTADTYVPTEMVHPLYAAHPGPKQLYLSPGAPHARSYQCHPSDYSRHVRNFVRRYAGWQI